MSFKKIAKLEDLWEGEMEAFEIDGQDVLLLWPEGGELCAYQGACPHQDIPLIEGQFDGKVLICRAHLWSFDGCTGKGLNPDDSQLVKYPLKVEDGEVLVQIEPITPPLTAS